MAGGWWLVAGGWWLVAGGWWLVAARSESQIPLVLPRHAVALPPYALEPIQFRFPALAALAGRAPMGGAREVALASFLAARLAHDALGEDGLTQAGRSERAAGARHWLASLALPAPVRTPLGRLVDATDGEPAAVALALRTFMAAAAQFLDPASRSELDRLAKALEAQALVK